MTTLNTEYLLNRTVYGEAGGNYDGSSQDFFGDPVRGANYYGGQGSIQTVTMRISGFVGNITIQATLNDQPSIEAAWFDVAELDSPSPNNAVDGRTITGNFTFLRAKITGFDSGIIDSIIAVY
jgi:hypothetical protein